MSLRSSTRRQTRRAAPKTRDRADEYTIEDLHPRLVSEGKIDGDLDRDALRLLRGHLNVAFNNDGAALAPAFAPYKTFGADYSAPSPLYVTNLSKNHGQSGSFVYRVLSASKAGHDVLGSCRQILEHRSAPLEFLGQPLLDADQSDWDDPYDGIFGTLDSARGEAIANHMRLQTEALGRLMANLVAERSPYALRYMVIGLCCWLFSYMLKLHGGDPILLIDALQGRNSRIRTQSRATWARQVDLFAASYQWYVDRGDHPTIDDEDWRIFLNQATPRKDLDDHLRDLGVRIGIVQPRAPQAKRKHIELQADTLRVVVLSLLRQGEVKTLPALASDMRKVWHVCTGADPQDGVVLREGRFGSLDTDADLVPNADGFKNLLIKLGLAVEPSDGLTLCAIDAEDLI